MKKYFLFLPALLSALTLGEIPANVTLHDHLGGRLDSSPFNTSEIKNKVYFVTYVDPDVSETNKNLNDAIRAKKFDGARYGAFAIINMASTWIPNVLISSKLKTKQEQYPRVTFVKDSDRVLVEKWGLKDNDSNVLIFGKNGALLYQKSGEHNDADIAKVIAIIEANL